MAFSFNDAVVREHEENARAKRVLPVDESATPFSATNPFPTSAQPLANAAFGNHTFSATADTYNVSVPSGYATMTFRLGHSGSHAGGAAILIYGIINSTVVSLGAVNLYTGALSAGLSYNNTGGWVIPVAGLTAIRFTSFGTFDVGETFTIEHTFSPMTSPIILANPIPTGANIIGKVGQDLSGDFWRVGIDEVTTDLPVTAISLPLPTGASTEATAANIKAKTDNLDIALTTLRDALRGGSSKTLTDVVTALGAVVLASGTALIGKVSASPETSTVYNGTTALTPRFAKVGTGSSGDNTLVSAVTSKKLRVLACAIIWNADTNIYFHDNAGTPVPLFGDSTNTLGIKAGGGFVLPFNPAGWFETTAGQALVLNQSAANKGAGSLTYVEV